MNSACVMLPSPFLSCEGTRRASARTQTRARTHTDERAARATYSQRQNAPKGLHTLSRFLYRCLSLFHSVSLPPSLPPPSIYIHPSLSPPLYLYIPPCPSPPTLRIPLHLFPPPPPLDTHTHTRTSPPARPVPGHRFAPRARGISGPGFSGPAKPARPDFWRGGRAGGGEERGGYSVATADAAAARGGVHAVALRAAAGRTNSRTRAKWRRFFL